MVWGLGLPVLEYRVVPCNTASHPVTSVSDSSRVRGKRLTLAHAQVTGATAPGPDSKQSPEKQEGASFGSHQAGRAGPRRRPGCVIHSHHCPGPWHDPHSQLPFSRSQAAASPKMWVRMGSGVHHHRREPHLSQMQQV